MFMCCLEYSN